MWSIIAQSVVDLPEPVGPVTSTRPLFNWQSCRMWDDSPSCSAVRILEGMTRNTAPGPLRSANTFARKRASPAISVGEVRIVPGVELRAVLLRHDRLQQGAEIADGERRGGRIERLQPAVLADDRRRIDRQMEVGRAGGGHRVEEGVDRRRSAHGFGTSLISITWAMLTSRVVSPVSM